MTKKEIIELYLADLNNLVPDSDAKRSRVIDLEDELEALRIHDVVGRSEQLVCDKCDFVELQGEIYQCTKCYKIEDRLAN